MQQQTIITHPGRPEFLSSDDKKANSIRMNTFPSVRYRVSTTISSLISFTLTLCTFIIIYYNTNYYYYIIYFKQINGQTLYSRFWAATALYRAGKNLGF